MEIGSKTFLSLCHVYCVRRSIIVSTCVQFNIRSRLSCAGPGPGRAAMKRSTGPPVTVLRNWLQASCATWSQGKTHTRLLTATRGQYNKLNQKPCTAMVSETDVAATSSHNNDYYIATA